MDLLYVYTLVFLCCCVHHCLTTAYKETTSQVCTGEEFQARCPFSQQILTTQARYGHIEISRCVGADFGHLGCYADIRDLVAQRCDSKTRCEIASPDPQIAGTKTCFTGLAMYMDISYVCIPQTVPQVRCGGMSVIRRLQYITSVQVQQAKCEHTAITFTAPHNLNIMLKLSRVSGHDNLTSVGYIAYEGSDPKDIVFSEAQDVDVLIENNQATLHLLSNNNVMLIGFQAQGCDDLDPPPYSWTQREGSITTLGCENAEHTWTLRCIGIKWVGSLGNCTQKIKEIVPPVVQKQQPEPIKATKQNLSKEILFALIIGVTVFLCAVVITVGFVCLKISKYKATATTKNTIEMRSMMYEGEGTTSWRKVNKNNEPPSWQQTLPNGQVVQCNGTMSANGQKYYILDRDDMSTLQV